MRLRVRRAVLAAMFLALAACKDYDSAVPLGPASEGVIEPRVGYDRAQRKDAFEPFMAEEGGVA